MTASPWKWKGKDGSASGLLYESGNWGDLLKALWVSAVVEWKNRRGLATGIDYLDVFAGQTSYPLGGKTLFRFRQAGLRELECINIPYVHQGRWPSAAAIARLLTKGTIRVFEADPERRESWADTDAILLPGNSGWEIMAAQTPDNNALWLLDPYDFLAEWRAWLPTVAEKSRRVTILLYIYNRSAAKAEAFAEYRTFRNRLDDMRGVLPKRLGRVASDAFLPRAHHEMLLLPSAEDAEEDDFAALSNELGRRCAKLAAALQNAAAFDM